MSRIGKMPIAIPAGVTVEFKDSVVTVKGPKGALTREIVGNISVETEGTNVVLKALDNSAETNAKHGLYRALVNGMVTGVSAGFVKALEVKGVGWKAAVQGNKLVALYVCFPTNALNFPGLYETSRYANNHAVYKRAV